MPDQGQTPALVLHALLAVIILGRFYFEGPPKLWPAFNQVIDGVLVN